MHKIQEKEFTLEDFSTEHLNKETMYLFEQVINYLNISRDCYNSAVKEKDTEWAKDYWWQMIQLLPSSYNQKRTVMLNYEVLANIYKSRKNHKLDEWRELCKWIENLPYSELITKTCEKKDLVEVIRCKNCEYYISSEDMKKDNVYRHYDNHLNHDGLCMNADTFTYEDDFCSCGMNTEEYVKE